MTTLAAPVSSDAVWQVVAEVWQSVLGLPARRAEHAFSLDDALTASVGLHGPWNGVVTLTCPPAAGEAMARVMLDLAVHDTVTQEDVEDAVGEVANVVGGNIKALLAGADRLGLPQVGTGWVPSRSQPLCRTGVAWGTQVARVGVWRLVGDCPTDREANEGGLR